MLQASRLQTELAAGRTVVGPFCKMSDPTVYELAGLAGFDFAIIDMEHGPLGFESAQQLVRTCEMSGISPVVRIPANRAEYVQRALDIGAHAVQVPEINTPADAQSLVKAAKFHPNGSRGVCRFVRAAQYTHLNKQDYFGLANRQQRVIAHIEGRTGFENLDAILAVDGISIIFIGPYDLSQSIGIPGQTDHPQLQETMADIVRRARAAGKTVGTFVETPEQAAHWIAGGVEYISYSVDVGLLLQAFAAAAKAVREQSLSGRLSAAKSL